MFVWYIGIISISTNLVVTLAWIIIPKVFYITKVKLVLWLRDAIISLNLLDIHCRLRSDKFKCDVLSRNLLSNVSDWSRNEWARNIHMCGYLVPFVLTCFALKSKLSVATISCGNSASYHDILYHWDHFLTSMHLIMLIQIHVLWM